jgi:hypothetical protein
MLCKFNVSEQDGGSVFVVQAQFESSTKLIKCDVNTSLTGNATVAVALNGVDYTKPLDYFFYDQPTPLSVAPAGLAAHLKSKVLIRGSGFFDSGVLRSDYKCSLVAVNRADKLPMYAPYPNRFPGLPCAEICAMPSRSSIWHVARCIVVRDAPQTGGCTLQRDVQKRNRSTAYALFGRPSRPAGSGCGAVATYRLRD